MYKVIDETSTTRLWLKLENLYMTKNLSNKLFLKKQLCNLRLKKGIPILEHMNIFNRIVSDLLCLEVKLKEKDKALLLASLTYQKITGNKKNWGKQTPTKMEILMTQKEGRI